MKRVLTTVAALGLLTACSVGEDGDFVVGTPGSSYRLASASTETKLAHYAEVCKGYGFEPGTPEIANCAQVEAAFDRETARQKARQFADALGDIDFTPNTSRTSCSRLGNTVNCNTTSY